MAKGDIISGLTAGVGSGAQISYQPAAGVETMITVYGSSSAASDVHCEIYNGTIAAFIGANTAGENNVRVPINNSVYLRIQNNNAGSQTLGYSGIQVK